MKAVLYDAFLEPPSIETVADPETPPHGVVVKVEATGVCRSDWHGWCGHDPDITLPHVPGHELAGVVEEVGRDVVRWRKGDRVTVPFVGGCGACPQCHTGDHQICDHQFQPGFTHWGSFASHVAIQYADTNLVALPGALDFATAASLGCRFATAFRGVVDQGRLQPGQWLAVHGAGGVGLSAIMIGHAMGANVIAIDIAHEALELARSVGATALVNASDVQDVPAAIRDLSGGGAHVSVDALGHRTTCVNSVESLRKRGRHIQIGLMVGADSAPPVPMGRVIAHELEILGSHGMQAHRYPAMLAMIEAGTLAPEKLIGHRIGLEDSIDTLTTMDAERSPGITVVTEFPG
ncbi:MAG: zinc-dependent alcohol dehydrogenase family protein [Pseudomonadota bacterium]